MGTLALSENYILLSPEWATLPFPNHTEDHRGRLKSVHHIVLDLCGGTYSKYFSHMINIPSTYSVERRCCPPQVWWRRPSRWRWSGSPAPLTPLTTQAWTWKWVWGDRGHQRELWSGGGWRPPATLPLREVGGLQQQSLRCQVWIQREAVLSLCHCLVLLQVNEYRRSFHSRN